MHFSQILERKRNSFFSPVVVEFGFDGLLFEIEKKIASKFSCCDMDDSFYFTYKELDKLFFHDEPLQLI